GALATDASCQLHVLGHDGDTLGVNRTHVGVLKEPHQVGLACLLQGANGSTLEAQIGLKVLRDLTNQALDWQLADQQLRRRLVTTALTQRHRARSVTVRLLYTAGGRRTLASHLLSLSSLSLSRLSLT
uniref:Uncharacterized protein n=1 Tax=Petromyzon marinus TaxID=7757 RepID=S4RFW5_PETMA